MLPPFIIDQIRKREDDDRARRDAEQPRLELPNPNEIARRMPHASDLQNEEPDDANRGVFILQL
jgi:hypothetical protein